MTERSFAGPGPLQIHQEALAAGKFIIQQCRDCGRHIFHPRVLCQHCGSTELKWISPTGRGTVCSTSIVHQTPERGGDYSIALIDLEEGVRLMGRVVDVLPEKVKIGMKVSAQVSLIDGEPALVFITVEQGASEW
ncbi:MAG: Zn-ribbon domain-containing OB-fold protein [Pseudomonadales bacterium]|nr:Zn-ribbon domain-containing OB-fold protein [Pseudomonadales bacterium]